MKRAIVTGPTGAIGIALIEKLASEDVEVTAVCRKGSQRIQNVPQNSKVKIVECSLDHLNALTDLVKEKQDVFYHFAWDGTFGEARNDMYLQNRNVEYTLNAVETAKKLGCEAFIGAGSQAEYGRVEGVLKPDTPAYPENGYGIAKLCAGQMSRILCEHLGIRHVWARILSVYGPYDGENTLVMSAIRKLLKGEIPEFTKGEQQWDYLYSKDAAAMFYALGLSGKNGSVYCLGSGQARPLKEYIYEIRNQINPDAELGLGKIPYGDKQVMYLCADTAKLREDTGYTRCCDFSEGISETIQWYKGRIL